MRKNWLWYQMFRYPMVGFGLRLFYRKIKITNRENVPADKPVLFVPNHQNSFMDALLVVTQVRHFIYFLTRAQAFNPPIMAKFLRSLNMLPVYRVRDGISSVTKNNAIFDECISYLKRNDAVLIFAEANHAHKRRVRPLSKGFTRIAFDAEVKTNWEMDLKVIPVGLNYTEHRNSRNDVNIVFGEPIDMKEYKELFEEDERAATEDLKSKVSEGMKKTIMHVEDLEHYPLHHILLDDLETDPSNYIQPEIVNKNVTIIEEKAEEADFETAREVKQIADKHGIRIKTFFANKKNWLKYVILSPVYAFSWINNIIPYQPARWLVANKIKDHVFDVSIKFVVGLLIFPLFWLIVSLILLVAGFGWKVSLGYFLASAVTSVFFKDANVLFRERRERKEFREFERQYPDEFQSFVNGIKKLNELRSQIL